MNTYTYAAVDAQGRESRGTIQVATQSEALQRIKDMGFFPIKITPVETLTPAARTQRHLARLGLKSKAATQPKISFRGRLKTRQLTVFTRQLATLLDAGMPLLRGLRLLEEQESNPRIKKLISGLGLAIEGGSTFSEALSQFPGVFDRLYINMVKAGELGGQLEVCLQRLAEFMEKAGRIKGKVKAAMYYPAAVLTVAGGVLALMTFFIIPRFKEVFAGLYPGQQLPAFTRFVLGITDTITSHFLLGAILLATAWIGFIISIRTRQGRRLFDRLKLKSPIVGPLFRKLAISRFTRTLGTLCTSGVPILQALNIVKEATGNVIMGRLVGQVHENVKEGGSIVGPLRHSGIFPVMVAGMVDVGEQTGALPEMLNRIADNYDEEIDNSVAALTSLLEPILIVFLAIIVGTVVIALFLPIIPQGEIGSNTPGDM